MTTTSETHPYDIWPPRENFACPQIVTRWQRELNLVAGFTPNQLPMLRLEFGSVCTISQTNRDLKYYYSTRESQTGWAVDVLDNSGVIVKTLRFTMKQKLPEPSRNLSCARAIMKKEQIGIPRFWVSQYIPPTLIGPWDDVKRNIMRMSNNLSDIGEYPREGFYWRGFHLIAQHQSDGSGRFCCDRAKDERRTCFGMYREPSDLDILYCSQLWKLTTIEHNAHSWTEAASEQTMRKVLMNLNNAKEDRAKKEREEMKLRIRDAFNSHRGKFTARKGRDTFYIHRPNEII